MLTIEVAGYGICQDQGGPPYVVYIICVQQESLQTWYVYRRYTSFVGISDQLRVLHPDIFPVPFIAENILTGDKMEENRNLLDTWLQNVIANPLILRTQSMYHFLCADANVLPPFIDVHWRNSNNGSFDDMDMEEMFDKDDEGVEDESAEMDEGIGMSKTPPNSVWRFSQQRPPEDDENDGMDIKSLSVVKEAEFIFNRATSGVQMGGEGGEQQAAAQPAKRTINLEAFNIIRVVGKGSFGKVFLVREKESGKLYAMKVLKKDYIIRKNQVEHTKTERNVLGYVHHPFIVGLNMAFQTADKLFFVLDYCAGGELFFHLGRMGRFPESQARFYTAQIIMAIEYVHSHDIIYRDLKPENVLLDHHGNVRLTDFGLSKEGVSDDSSGANSFCGTPEYIAPEVLLRQGHGRAVDWWSTGALLYEMLSGLPPFYSRSREVMFEKIMKAELNFPSFLSESAKDLLRRLLVRDPKKRLGSGEADAAEIKAHGFFYGLDWERLYNGSIPPPWTPKFSGSLDTSLFDQEFTSIEPIVSPDVRGAYFGSLDGAFEGFTFVDESASQMMMSSSVQNRGGMPHQQHQK